MEQRGFYKHGLQIRASGYQRNRKNIFLYFLMLLLTVWNYKGYY